LFAISNDDGGSGNGGGTIGSNAIINVGAASISTGGPFSATIDNFGGGTIGGNATINVTAASITANSLLAQIDNSNGGSIGFLSGSSANVTLNVGGDLTTTQGDATFQILNSDNGSGPGTIGSDAVINVAANNVSTGGALVADIFNLTGGTIGGNATVNVTANNISAGGGRFSASILNDGGNIGLDAAVNVSAASISTTNELVTNILNFGGTIGGNATIIDLTAANINTQALDVEIFNPGGSIGSGANVTLNVGGDLTNQGGTGLAGINNEGGTIVGNATINLTAANITAPSLLAQIDNSNGGSIGGNAAINMNVSGSATIANATFQILGSDGAAAAAINFNNGSYDVGGTLLSLVDGNGTITFNNASAHADVLKAGVFGTNGVLNVGGGSLSADTTLKLYAPGSNGQLNFVSNVTLGGNSAKILAANSVTIFNNIVVTIGGPNPADVFVNFVGGVPNANYTGFGGNGTTTGTFAGAGANNPLPLSSAPPFGPSPIATRTRIPPPSNVLTGGKIADVRRANNVINVRSSDELLTLLDDAVPGPGGKITIPASKITNNSRHSSRVDAAGRFNPVSRLNADRRAMDMRTTSSSLMRRLPQ
jgi:filamentous hemagglutinin